MFKPLSKQINPHFSARNSSAAPSRGWRATSSALKHSECPTALDGGKLGDLPRGKLFPELDKALFELKAGEVSGVLESELGFHVLRCDSVTEASVLGYEQAKQHIRKLLE